jgi:hypothetical protein
MMHATPCCLPPALCLTDWIQRLAVKAQLCSGSWLQRRRRTSPRTGRLRAGATLSNLVFESRSKQVTLQLKQRVCCPRTERGPQTRNYQLLLGSALLIHSAALQRSLRKELFAHQFCTSLSIRSHLAFLKTELRRRL